MKRNKTSNVDNKVNNFTINDTTDSNGSTSNSKTNEDSKYSDTYYQHITSDGNSPYSLNENNATRGNWINQINYIRQTLKTKYDTTITFAFLETQNRKLRQKFKIIPTTKYVPQLRTIP